MGTAYFLRCDSCEFERETSGPWEFYRTPEGRLKDYGHPVARSEEAEEAGIHGLYGNLYCPACGRVRRRVVLVEFRQPTDDKLGIWAGRIEPSEESVEKVPACRECGGVDLILQPPEDRELPCPECSEGKLSGGMAWVS